MASYKKLLLIDIGNHSIKAALFRDGAIEERRRYERGGGDLTITALLDEAGPDGAAYCSVVPDLGTALQEV